MSHVFYPSKKNAAMVQRATYTTHTKANSSAIYPLKSPIGLIAGIIFYVHQNMMLESSCYNLVGLLLTIFGAALDSKVR